MAIPYIDPSPVAAGPFHIAPFPFLRANGSVVFLREGEAALDLREDGGASSGVIRMRMGGANARLQAVAEQAAPGRVN